MSDAAETKKVRRLAAIVFTDVVGYSSRMQVDEAGTLALVQSDFEQMRARCQQHGGQVLKSTGDGLLMCFDSVVDAVTSALEIQAGFSDRGTDALQHRIGIHLGDVYHQGGDVAGDGVNLAARLQTAAQPGAICVSNAVFAAVHGKVPMESAALDPLVLKNIAQPFDAYLIAPVGSRLSVGGRRRGARIQRGLAYAAVGAALLVGASVLVLYSIEPPVEPVASSPALSNSFPRDPDLKRARTMIYALDSIVDDFRLADDIVTPLLVARPNDPEVVTVAAEVSQAFLTRTFDITQARRAQAQRLTGRAVQLAPENPEALAALGNYLALAETQLGRAEELLRRAIEFNPNEARFHRALYGILTRSKPAEAAAIGARMLAKFPDDPLVIYDIALRYLSTNDLATTEEWVDKTLALTQTPLSNAFSLKARLRLELHGDVEGMKRWLERVPERQQANARMAYLYAVLAKVTGQTAPAARLLDTITDTWLTDIRLFFPKALIVAEIAHIDGHDDVARLQYEAALKEIHTLQSSVPSDLRPAGPELWALLGLGRLDDARTALQVNFQLVPRPYRQSMYTDWWFSPLRAGLLLGERAKVLPLLKEACAEPVSCLLLRNLIHVDPRMAPFRNDPEIVTLLSEPKAETPTTQTTPGSEQQ